MKTECFSLQIIHWIQTFQYTDTFISPRTPFTPFLLNSFFTTVLRVWADMSGNSNLTGGRRRVIILLLSWGAHGGKLYMLCACACIGDPPSHNGPCRLELYDGCVWYCLVSKWNWGKYKMSLIKMWRASLRGGHTVPQTLLLKQEGQDWIEIGSCGTEEK